MNKINIGNKFGKSTVITPIPNKPLSTKKITTKKDPSKMLRPFNLSMKTI